MAEAIRRTSLWRRMTGGVIVATVLQTAPPGSTEGRLHYDSDCRLIIPAGRMHSPLRQRPSGTNLPLHHLQAPAPPQTPQQPALTSLWQRRLCAPPLSWLDWWLIGGLIDYDSCVCRCVSGPVSLRWLAAHLLTLEPASGKNYFAF